VARTVQHRIALYSYTQYSHGLRQNGNARACWDAFMADPLPHSSLPQLFLVLCFLTLPPLSPLPPRVCLVYGSFQQCSQRASVPGRQDAVQRVSQFFMFSSAWVRKAISVGGIARCPDRSQSLIHQYFSVYRFRDHVGGIHMVVTVVLVFFTLC
jgi:hypothetical protein